MSYTEQLFEKAKQYIPGGVNSPVRSFSGVGGTPVFFKKAKGAYVYDEEGNSYIDYVGSWGPMILGHNHPNVISAVQKQLEFGLSFGAPNVLETGLAQKVCHLIPSIDLIRMTSSGTEATMSAIRLARGFTGRDKIVKFTGCYHGHSDSLLVNAGSGALTLGVPSSPGVPVDLAQHTISLTYNNLAEVEQTFARIGEKVAAIIIEPVAGNMNCIPPVPGFLQGLRSICDKYGSVLIFDEVMTGFRVALGGAQEVYGVKPDLTTLGKIIGAGMPVGAFGGKREIMEQIAPLGPVYQAGTLSGNPVAMAAGLALLQMLEENPNIYLSLEKNTKNLVEGLTATAKDSGIALTTNQVGAMFGIFFSKEDKIERYDQLGSCNLDFFRHFFHAMLNKGVYLAPSAYEAGFVSTCHNSQEIDKTLEAAASVFKKLKV